MTTALALPSSKTNWTATVPARAPPPPPPVKEILGQCHCCECDVTTDQDYLKLKTGLGAGRIYCEEHVGWGECQKAWSGSCGCDVCADQEEEDDGARCDICCGCGKFTETGNVCDCGGAHRELCDDCKEEEATTEFARNKICDECGCKGGCELTCVYVCGEDSEEVKHYKAVLAETLRYEAIMDMMKK